MKTQETQMLDRKFIWRRKQRVSWMIKNMHHNKVFKYKSQNKSVNEKKDLLKELSDTYLLYRENWKNQPLRSFKINYLAVNSKKNNFLHYVLILK